MKVTPNQEMNELLSAGSVFNIVVESGSVVAVGTLNNEIIFNETISTSRVIGNYEHDVQFKIFSVGGIAEVNETLDTASAYEAVDSDIYKREDLSPKTLTGTYTGNGTSQSITLNFRPSLVIIKGNTTEFAIFGNDTNFMKRTDFFLNSASISGTDGILITDTGFTVGSSARANGNTITYYYFAYCDNGSDNLLQGNWAGNGTAGRTVDLFTRRPIAGAICKRDNSRAAVWIVGDATQNYWYNGSSNAVSTGTTLDSATGVLTLGSGDEINQWSGLLGEGVNCLAFAKDSEAVTVKTYTGTGSARNVTLPFIPDAFIIATRSTTSPTSRMWFSSLSSGQSLPTSNIAIGTGEFTVSGSRIAFSGTTFNATGIEYVIYAFRRLRFSTWTPPNPLPVVINKAAELASTGYVDCGTSNTLQINGPITMEWFGTVYLPDTGQYTGSADIDTLAGNQDKLTPLIFRSSGADATAGAVSFGMCISAGTVSVDTYIDCSVLVAMHDYWGMLQSNSSGDLDNHPWNTGITIPANENVHILVTHAGDGYWTLYVNGVRIKERKRNELLASTPRANVTGYSGHKTVIGGRLRDGSIANANGCTVRLARIYSRALREDEAMNNYLSLFGKANKTLGFVEEWNANNASGTTLRATVNSENNGTITNGLVI